MQSAKLRPVYFRRKDKATYAVTVKPGSSFRSLSTLLSKREGIAPENLLMVHGGKVLESLQSLENPLSPQRENIVHVINLADVKRDTVRFNLKGLDGVVQEWAVGAGTRVGDFVRERLARVDQVPHFYIGLVYVGKVMDPQKTFLQEFVEEDCEIVAVNLVDCLRKVAAKGNGRQEGKMEGV